MTRSEDLFEWGQHLMVQLQGEDLTTAIDRAPPDRGNRSTHLLVESETRSCELSVWDSGDAECFIADRNGFEPAHVDISGSADARALIEWFVAEASLIAGRELRI